MRGRSLVGATLALLLSTALSGCLADDIWREPFAWQERGALGENPDGAQAFANALSDLGDRARQSGDDVVVSTVEDLPEGAVFQNMRDFLNRQDPGRGDQVDETARNGTGQARDAYVTLTGPAGQALDEATGPIEGTQGTVPISVAERATRVRVDIDVVLVREADEEGTNPTPLGNVHIRLWDPAGHLRINRTFDTSRAYNDLFVVGTYGDANEVREHLGGTWRLDVQADGEGAWSVVLEAYEPRFDDYVWWEFWRGQPREVATA